ncbi:MAG: hypothetical protein NT069_00005 [Planctomycetota bacterium]|nr:hypothetical protein [Planctomycetota bacterium]
MSVVTELLCKDQSCAADGSRNGLLILAGHAIYQQILGEDTNWWGGLGYPGEDRVLENHVQSAVEIASRLRYRLVASGGRTRPNLPLVKAGKLTCSEAEGIRAFALDKGLIGCDSAVGVEPWARDSCENLVFSLLNHFHATGRWPDRLGVVSFSFKAQRFLLVANALGMDLDFFGANDGLPRDQLFPSVQGELAFLNQILPRHGDDSRPADPLMRGPVFAAKRNQRTPTEFTTNAEYLDAIKAHYCNNPTIDRVIDLVDAIEPASKLQEVDWPWRVR